MGLLFLAEMPEAALKDIFSYLDEKKAQELFHEGKAEDLVYFLDFFKVHLYLRGLFLMIFNNNLYRLSFL